MIILWLNMIYIYIGGSHTWLLGTKSWLDLVHHYLYIFILYVLENYKGHLGEEVSLLGDLDNILVQERSNPNLVTDTILGTEGATELSDINDSFGQWRGTWLAKVHVSLLP